MLGPFLHVPPPDEEKDKRVAWAVAWVALGMGALMMLLWAVLPP